MKIIFCVVPFSSHPALLSKESSFTKTQKILRYVGKETGKPSCWYKQYLSVYIIYKNEVVESCDVIYLKCVHVGFKINHLLKISPFVCRSFAFTVSVCKVHAGPWRKQGAMGSGHQTFRGTSYGRLTKGILPRPDVCSNLFWCKYV